MRKFDKQMLIILMVLFLASAKVILCSDQFTDNQCEEIVLDFDWCNPFLEGKVNYVAPQCCNGLMNLNSIAGQIGPRKICECIENDVKRKQKYNYIESRIFELYVECEIHLSFPISEYMDCSRV